MIAELDRVQVNDNGDLEPRLEIAVHGGGKRDGNPEQYLQKGLQGRVLEVWLGGDMARVLFDDGREDVLLTDWLDKIEGGS